MTPAFARLWDSQFATFGIWGRARRGSSTRRTGSSGTELDKARRSRRSVSSSSRLEAGALTIAAPGGLDWWPQAPPPDHARLDSRAARVVELELLATPARDSSLLGAPECAANRPGLRPAATAARPATGAGRQRRRDATAASAAVDGGGDSLGPASCASPRPGRRRPRIGSRRIREQGCVDCCEECGCEHDRPWTSTISG